MSVLSLSAGLEAFPQHRRRYAVGYLNESQAEVDLGVGEL